MKNHNLKETLKILKTLLSSNFINYDIFNSFPIAI